MIRALSLIAAITLTIAIYLTALAATDNACPLQHRAGGIMVATK